MKLFTLTRIIALGTVFTATAAVPMSTAIAQAPPPASTAQFSQDTIRALQQALNKQGIAVAVDGVLGEATRAAIRKYQTEHHLSVTGEPDRATLDKLGVKVATGEQAAAPQADLSSAPGMMGRGMMGQGTMGGQMGGGMMGPGMMGPGMMGGGMMGQGMMGQGMGTGGQAATMGMGRQPMSTGMMSMMSGLIYGVPGGELTAERVKELVEGLLAWHGNPRLKAGKVVAEGSEIIAEIVTQDGSLVQKLAFNRYPGFVRQLP